ncbi:MAG: hypothetical protein WKG00_01160 [Polyangiaceae bacterium]
MARQLGADGRFALEHRPHAAPRAVPGARRVAAHADHVAVVERERRAAEAVERALRGRGCSSSPALWAPSLPPRRPASPFCFFGIGLLYWPRTVRTSALMHSSVTIV